MQSFAPGKTRFGKIIAELHTASKGIKLKVMKKQENNLGRLRSVFMAGLVAFSLPFHLTPDPAADFDYGDQPHEPILEGVNETSSGMASGLATPDGRALLWKSRDRGGTAPVEFHYVSDGRIPFIGVTDVNDTARYYSGVNAEGFAIENTDNHNNADRGPHNDGITMRMALATCRIVDDFVALLDSANLRDVNGRYGYDYGVIDAYGGAAIFECHRFDYVRFDAAEAVGGILVRTNFSYTGSVNPNDDPSFYGVHRHNQGMKLFKQAADDGNLNVNFILRMVVRDLTTEDFDPYPLPFRGYYNNLPYGNIVNATAICRQSTTAVTVVQGVMAGERPDNTILWAMNGSPVTGIATPLWVRAGSVPPEYDGVVSSPINNRIIQLYNWANGAFGGALDTWRLTNPDGNGLWDYLLPLQDQIITKTEQFRTSPRFHYDRLQGFQNEMAQQINDSLWAWKPTFKIAEQLGLVFWNGHVTLRYGAPRIPDGDEQAGIIEYRIFRASEPFREGMRGELIGATQDTTFTDESPLANGGFYQVEARF